MTKYTKSTLKKLLGFFEDQGYRILYEKGTFNSGYCVVNHSKTLVINKHFDLKGKINVLIDIANELNLSNQLLKSSFHSEKSKDSTNN